LYLLHLNLYLFRLCK